MIHADYRGFLIGIRKKLLSYAKSFLVPSSTGLVKAMPWKFCIDQSSILLGTTSFRFDVPGHGPNPAVTIGRDSMVGCSFVFESTGGEIRIGERCYIGGGTSLISRTGITIGDDVWIAWGCSIYDHDSHSIAWRDRREDLFQQIVDYRNSGNYVLNKDWSRVKSKPIIIGDKVWIGFDSVILKGVTIGEGAIIGARAVVSRNVDPWTVVAGNPARVVRSLDHE
jgi:acetyltransferase-like isoleucine patch superfamily enzyme